MLGVDTLSPDETVKEDANANADFGVHETILGSGAMIVENLTGLDLLPSDHVYVSLLPLALTGMYILFFTWPQVRRSRTEENTIASSYRL